MSDDTKRTQPKRRLGRGLSSLIPTYVSSAAPREQYQAVDEAPTEAKAKPIGVAAAGAGWIAEIPVDQIAPNPYQPRQDFDEVELAELAASIAEQGLLQPLIVAVSRVEGEPRGYVLVAGERRLRAARLAGLAAVPSLVREATPQQMLEWALVENLQRTDLNPMERASGYQQYMDRFNLTQAEASERLGQARANIANHLRLLELEGPIQSLLRQGRLSFGHAKVLAGAAPGPERVALARRAAEAPMSVRQVEELVAKGLAAKRDAAPAAVRERPAYLADLEEQMMRALGTRVAIRPGRAKNKGRVVIEYYTLEDFERIAERLGVVLEG